MQKWEYCQISRIIFGSEGVKGEDLVMTHFTEQGPKIAKPKSNVRYPRAEDVADMIVHLGIDGWEMVGCGNATEHSHAIYFKRPIED